MVQMSFLIIAIWGAVIDRRYIKSGGQKVSRLEIILWWISPMLILLSGIFVIAVRNELGSEETANSFGRLIGRNFCAFFAFYEGRRWLVRRKYPINTNRPLSIFRVHHSAWKMFRQHHYLDTNLSVNAHCFIAMWGDRPVAFSSWISLWGKIKNSRREHRTVTLPDYQGIGIGNKVSEFCASLYCAVGQKAFSTTSHPGMIRYRHASPNWRTTRMPDFASERVELKVIKRSTLRLTAGFEYIGPRLDAATAKGILE